MLVKSVEIIFDGKLVVVFFDDTSTYLQPPILVHTFQDDEIIRLIGVPNKNVQADITIEVIDGVPFSGNFDELDITLREAVEKANNIYNKAIAQTARIIAPVSILNILEEIQINGKYRGKTAYAFNIVGQRNGFTSTSILNDIKEYDNGVAGFAVTDNSTLDIISTSPQDSADGTGCRTVKVTYINSENALVESPSIALNGTTLVTSVLTGVNQVLWMETETAGSSGVAAGNVILRINGDTVQCEQITAGGNKSRSAIFQVPVGFTGYAVNWQVSAVNNDQDVRLVATVNTLDRSLNTTAYHYISEKYAASNTNILGHDLWLKLPALSRIKASTMSAGVASTIRCNVNLLIILIEN